MLHDNALNFADLYATALSGLKVSPDDVNLKHQAVLALARAGSLSMAFHEYSRYGLDEIRHHEDIIGLGARLLKDLFITHQAPQALDYARDSAQKYEAAYQDTGGYYSGINSATMALLADMPVEIVKDRAKTILTALPPMEKLEPENLYYVEATRAEAFMLLEQYAEAKEALSRAVRHDPLNYAAHATTLRQFNLIANKMGGETDWIDILSPPKSVHFAGHLFSLNGQSKNNLNMKYASTLQAEISDALQSHDIGFGYGALAAGADILIAETLLEEGAQLHVVLPVSEERFREVSVTAFGEEWGERYRACLELASSVTIISETAKWPCEHLNRYAAQISMGKAVMQAGDYSADVAQLLVWNKVNTRYGTAEHARDWNATKRPNIFVPYTGIRAPVSEYKGEADTLTYRALLLMPNGSTQLFGNAKLAAIAALEQKQSAHESDVLYLSASPADSVTEKSVLDDYALGPTVPGSVIMTEAFANMLAYEAGDEFVINFVGLSNQSEKNCYSLQASSLANRGL